MVDKKTQTSSKSLDQTKKRKKNASLEMGVYIARLHKKTDNKTRLSMKSLVTINEMVLGFLRDLSRVMRELKQKTKTTTISINDVKAAIRLIAGDGELSKHCIMEGSKA